MATRLKIKTKEDNNIHFLGFGSNYTLCGLETGGDKGMGIYPAKTVKVKVNCPMCVKIVEYCQNIDMSEWK